MSTITVIEEVATVVGDDAPVTLISEGIQGPPGPQGPMGPAGSTSVLIKAGACALILSARPDLGLADVKSILAMSANKTLLRNSSTGYSTLDGHGIINIGEAVKLAQSWVPVGSKSPQAVIVRPKANQTFLDGETFEVEVSVTDDRQVSSVKLFLNGAEVATKTAAPFTFSVNADSATPGQNTLKAIAYDDLGQDSIEAQLSFRKASPPLYIPVEQMATEIPTLTGGVKYEIRARFFSALGDFGAWSEWVEFTAPDEDPVPLSDYFVEKATGAQRIHYTHPHAGQALEYRFKNGPWTPAPASPFELTGFVGTGDLEFRTSNATASSVPTSAGTFNFNRLYYVIYPAALSSPTAAQIVAGLDGLGNAAVAHGNEEASLVSAIQSFVNDATGLATDTAYRIAFVGTDGSLFSNVVVSDAWQTLSDGTIVRALVLENGRLAQIPTGQEGLGRKPIVIYQGTLKERTWSEGTPVVLDAGNLRTLTPDETLVI